MRKKIKGYALINSEDEYITFEQTGNRDVEVFATDDIGRAMIFDSYADAYEIGYDIKFGTGEWGYILLGNATPTDIAKVKKYIEVDKVGKVVDKR